MSEPQWRDLDLEAAPAGWRAIYITQAPPYWVAVPLVGWMIREQVRFTADGEIAGFPPAGDRLREITPVIWDVNEGLVPAVSRARFWSVLGPGAEDLSAEEGPRIFGLYQTARQARCPLCDSRRPDMHPTVPGASYVARCPDPFHDVRGSL